MVRRQRPKSSTWAIIALLTLIGVFGVNFHLTASTPSHGEHSSKTLPPKSENPLVVSTRATRSTAADASPTAAELDIQLFVLWHGSRRHWDAILDDAEKRFVVLHAEVIEWIAASDKTAHGERYFLENLWRLYRGKGGMQKTGMKLKTKQCGKGPFVAIVVGDRNLEMREEVTAHGTDIVSRHMHEAKTTYRKWSGGGFKVHGTFNEVEARHDIFMLFGREKDAFRHNQPLRRLSTLVQAHRPVNVSTTGFSTWASLQQFITALSTLNISKLSVEARPGAPFLPLGGLPADWWRGSAGSRIRVPPSEIGAVAATVYGQIDSDGLQRVQVEMGDDGVRQLEFRVVPEDSVS